MSGSVEPGSPPRETAQRPGAIILVRHGEPDLSRSGTYDAAGWNDWWARYNRTGLVPGQAPPYGLLERARLATHRLASPLPRAQETAALTFEGMPFATDEIFVEAALPAPPLPGWFRLSPRKWGAFTRICWWWGYAGADESHTLAQERADRAADRLINLVSDGGDAVVCAHGWFNRMIRGKLVGRGWTTTFDGGDSYWSWRCLEPPPRS